MGAEAVDKELEVVKDSGLEGEKKEISKAKVFCSVEKVIRIYNASCLMEYRNAFAYSF